MAGGLNDKQRRFVEEYLIDLNATQAAIRAGYSAKTAEQQGHQLLKKTSVAEAISAAQAKRSSRTNITADKVLAELAKIGFADIRKAVRWGRNPGDVTSENADPNGLNIYPVSLVPSEEMDDDTAAAVAEVSLTQTGVKIKMYDKRAALVDIGKHLGMFDGKDGDDDDAATPQNLSFQFIVNPAVGDVRVTKSERSTGDIPEGAEHQV